MTEHLEYISNYLQSFDRISIDTTVPHEPRWKEPVRLLKWLINMLLGFEWQAMISQSAHADGMHHSCDCQFYPTVQNNVLLVNLNSLKGPCWLYIRLYLRLSLCTLCCHWGFQSWILGLCDIFRALIYFLCLLIFLLKQLLCLCTSSLSISLTQTLSLSYTHTHTHTHTHTPNTHMHTHTCMHARTPARTHAHTHTHRQAPPHFYWA